VNKRSWFVVAAALLCLGALLMAGEASAQTVLPRLTIGVEEADSPEEVAVSLQILFLLTVLSLAPAILIMTTSFTRIVVVLSFVRSALSTNQMPPNQVLIGLALFLTFFIMLPTWQSVSENALGPYLAQEIGQEEAIARALDPVREFMLRHTRERDLALFLEISGAGQPQDPSDVPTSTLIPAFIISELKSAFQMGFILFIPFIVIDMIVASTLMSMGMLMLPPVMISLPFKILLFVMVDGWHIVVRSLLLGYQ